MGPCGIACAVVGELTASEDLGVASADIMGKMNPKMMESMMAAVQSMDEGSLKQVSGSSSGQGCPC